MDKYKADIKKEAFSFEGSKSIRSSWNSVAHYSQASRLTRRDEIIRYSMISLRHWF